MCRSNFYLILRLRMIVYQGLKILFLIRVEQKYMPSVKLRDNEPFEIALRRFKRTCEKAGVVAEVRAREYYEKPTSVRKREKAAAVKRNIKNLKREINRRVRMY